MARYFFNENYFYFRLDRELPRLQANEETFKILKNINCKFKDRLYLEFNMEIMRVYFFNKNLINLDYKSINF